MADYNDNIVWPGWETVRLIGRGSFGAVYEIERDMLGEKEKAALKVITIPQSSSDIDELYGEGYDDESITSTFKAYLKSIVAEYSLMRKMNGSANVVNCDDVRYVQHDDGFGWDIFIKMELLTPLTKSLGKNVSDEQVVRIGSDICKALILCKKHNIIHRDIKPANIFVSENGDNKLGDFGIAKTVEKTSGGTKIGTDEYMAPEVYHDQPYGSTVDIYSLGMVLYWLLNERRTPFLKMPPALPTSSEKEQARKRRFGGENIPAPKHGSDELKRIVLKACAYDPKDRYQSAEEMLSDFDALVGNGKNHIPDRGAQETDNSTSALGTADEEDENGKVKTQKIIEPEEEATVSALHQELRAEIEEKTVSAFAGDKPLVEIQITKGKRSKRKKSFIPILAAIVSVLVIAVVFFLQHSEMEQVFGLDMTLEDFEQQSAQLIDTAKTWTRETAPQTLNDFPLFPASVFKLFETINSSDAKIIVNGYDLEWTSNLSELLPSRHTGMEYSRTFDYVDPDKNSWVYLQFESIDDCKYHISLPDNVIENSTILNESNLLFYGHSYFDGWNEVLQVSYNISNKQIQGAPFIELIMSNNDYSISWCYLWGNTSVDIYSFSTGRGWELIYDSVSGELVNILK